MELIIISIFSALIVFITVYSIIKVLNIAYKRKEISVRKFRILVSSSIIISLLVVSILIFSYQKLFDAIL